MRALLFTSFFVIISLISPGSAYRILGIFSYNGKSHFIMYEQLLKGLAERGHQVDVVSHFPLKTPFPNYNQIVNLAGTVPASQNNLTYEFVKPDAKTFMVSAIAIKYGGDLCDFMDQPRLKEVIKNPPTDPPYDLLIVDTITDKCIAIRKMIIKVNSVAQIEFGRFYRPLCTNFLFTTMHAVKMNSKTIHHIVEKSRILGATCYLALGQHLKIPVVGTVSSAMWPWVNGMVANPDNPAYIPGVFTGFDGRMNSWERVSNALQLMKEKWEFDYYSAYQDKKIKKYIGPHAPSLREAERNVSLVLVNSHHSIHGARPYTTAVVEVGGLHISENLESLPKDLEKWLNDSKDGFVYISFGAMTKIESFPKTILRALYSSIAKLSPVRVLMKIANPKELPPGLPDNVLTHPWIPQLTVLKHRNVRAFLTHGGLLGTQEAVYCGVPMIGVSLFSDQAQNIKIYERKHVAVPLRQDQLTEEKFDAAFNAVLNDPSYMHAAKKLSIEFRDRPMSAMDTAIFWVEYVVRNGGENLRSPAMDLTWWQIALLDVYGALLFTIVFAVYISTLIIVKLIELVKKRCVGRLVSSKKVK